MEAIISKSSIRKIGNLIKENQESSEDLTKLNIYRNTHILVMNTLVNSIKDKTPKPLFLARRLKRLSSIRLKLQRFPNMQLDRMQDIGGVRAVFKNTEQAKEYAKKIISLYAPNKRALRIIKDNNYVDNPKEDGYRSHHIVFEYQKGKEELQGYKIELQIRDLNQHCWATAVEIFSLLTKNNLKIGEGDKDYKRFFFLCSKLLHNEATQEEEQNIKQLDAEYKILSLLSGANLAFHNIDKQRKDAYCLIALDSHKKQVTTYMFHKNDLITASLLYEKLEMQDNINVVLVDVGSIKNLKRAYPNYFGNAKEFIRCITNALNTH